MQREYVNSALKQRQKISKQMISNVLFKVKLLLVTF